MEADWIGVAGLAIAVGGLLLHVVRFVGDDKRFAAVQRREDARDASNYLLDLRGRLQDLKNAAVAYLDAPEGSPGKEAVMALYEPLEFLADRAEWDDVRTTALYVVYTCGRVTSNIERTPAEDQPSPAPDTSETIGLEQELEWAMAEASRVIGSRLDDLRKQGRAEES